MEQLVVVANVACWGAVVVVWVALGVRDGRASKASVVSGPNDPGRTLLAILAVAAIVLVGPSLLAPLAVDAVWVRLIGAVILLGSTIFAIWARVALGRSWSVDPQASTERGLRTDGPYAITRHPIYTGLLGLMLGTAILGGLGQWIALVLAGLIVAGLKIEAEERLLLATFPDAYRAYRDRVPRLLPRLRPPTIHRPQAP
jgi:protein-S-isoprenylcysteine O-methyltransferase Ste14